MFQFNQENHQKSQEILAKYPSDKKRSAIMPFLWLAQEQDGDNILSKDKIEYVAQLLSIPVIQVYEVATFYTMYNLENVGANHIQICNTVPCSLVGSKDILATIEKLTGVKENTISPNGKFSFSKVECLGACNAAPVIQINNKQYHEKMNKEKMLELFYKLSGLENI
ncbi:complex I 24 kDa subunit family protein [Candidatus Deianiraea vastatrix]|uniref:NADH-quinone oxidoreductase subunit E n=1 Tax=Candidatus Deianiraea vastatrix TaxID=2163644 RepID=A0A5B8XFD0_9RICK|nr:NAD(P)H-dependent oxidoreductase subunit E [Candidatus Deianiraea vastatrix]QED23635.1 NADH:ubiquinone oxidoreductase subunit E [Candidatus Deianiraea vastatrix]